jgi:hypothetical protein
VRSEGPAGKGSLAVWAGLIFVFSLVFYSLYFDRGMLLADEGTLMHAAQRINQGEVPYRDFYQFYAPGRFYIVAALFKVFGEGFLITRKMWVIVRALIVTLTFLIGGRFMPRRFAVLAPLVVLLIPGPWCKSFYAFAGLLALWATLRYVEDPRQVRLAVAAMTVAVALLLRQDVGTEAGVVLGLAVILVGFDRQPQSAWKAIVDHAALAGLVVVICLLPVVIYLWSHSAFAPMWRQVFGWATSYTIANVENTVKRLAWFGGRHFGLAVMFVAAPLASVWLITSSVLSTVRGGMDVKRTQALLVGVMGLVMLVPAYASVGAIRLYQTAPVAWIAVSYLICEGCEAVKRWPRVRAAGPRGVRAADLVTYLVVVTVGSAMVLGVMSIRGMGQIWTDYSGTITASVRNRTPFVLRGERVYLNEDKGNALQGLVRFIQERTDDDEPILVFPNQAMLYYLCDRPNRTRFLGTFTMRYPEEAQVKEVWLEWVKESRRVAPRYVIVNGDFIRSSSRHYFRRVLQKSYRREARFEEMFVFSRIENDP